MDRIGAPGERFDTFHPFCRKSSEKLKGKHLQKIFLSKRSRTMSKWWKKIENNFTEFFFENFLKSPVSRIVTKNVKGETLWDFLNVHSVAKCQKNWREDPLETLKHFANKKSHKAEITCTKKLVKGETRTHVLLLGRHQKLSYLSSMLSGSRSYKCGS